MTFCGSPSTRRRVLIYICQTNITSAVFPPIAVVCTEQNCEFPAIYVT